MSSPFDWQRDPAREHEVMTPKLAHRIAGFGRSSRSLGIASLFKPLGWLLSLPALILIRLYKSLLSPFLPPACRFEPSCSVYTFQAISSHGLIRGALLGAYRIGRCQPLCAAGYDPVPEWPSKELKDQETCEDATQRSCSCEHPSDRSVLSTTVQGDYPQPAGASPPQESGAPRD